MPEVAAAIGLAQLSRLPQFLEVRRKNAEDLSDGLGGLEKLKLPIEPEGHRHSWYVYTVRLRGANAGRRNRLVEKLREKRIGATVYYPMPIHLMPYYRERYGYDRGVLPKTETAARQVFSLPVHPRVTRGDIDYMTAILKKILK